MGNKKNQRSVSQTQKNKQVRYDPITPQKEPVASTSKASPNHSLASDKDIIMDTFAPKEQQQQPPNNILDPDEFVAIEDDDTMETGNINFIVVPRPTPFACASAINKTAKDVPTAAVVKALNNHFAQDDAFRGVNI
jgi:hypothetical protein